MAAMKRLFMQVLAIQQAVNYHLQLQAQESQAAQVVHVNALRTLIESTQ